MQRQTVVKTSAALVCGLLSGLVISALVESLGYLSSPRDQSREVHATADVHRNWLSAPVRVHVFLLLAWFAGPFCGAWVTVYLLPEHPIGPAWIVGAWFLLGGVVNLLTVPHPPWVATLGVLLFLPAAWLGGRMAQRRLDSQEANNQRIHLHDP